MSDLEALKRVAAINGDVKAAVLDENLISD